MINNILNISIYIYISKLSRLATHQAFVILAVLYVVGNIIISLNPSFLIPGDSVYSNCDKSVEPY